MHNEPMEKLADIAPPADAAQVRREVARLRPSGLLAAQGSLEVLLGRAGELPGVLHEIGRQREMAFRIVGEGTGKPLDLDAFDEHYLHLFLWDCKEERIGGAYRVGRTDVILKNMGPTGLYCSTLFEFEDPFLDHLTPGLELGRSFVTVDYQRSLGSLLALWKGLATYVARNPRYGKLFGPVSISGNYTTLSQNLMVKFMRENKREAALAPYVHPFHPFSLQPSSYGDISSRLECIEQVSARVADVEPDGKGVPILLKHYLKLNATLLEFNVDPGFANCLDALVLIDLHRTPDRLLGRYMGRTALRKFREESAAGAQTARPQAKAQPTNRAEPNGERGFPIR